MSSYIHGTDPREQQRLAALNRLTNEAFLQFLTVEPDSLVLEVGSGLGILAAAAGSAAPGVRVVGVERSPEQLAAAGRSPAHVAYVRGDAHALSFGHETFELVYGRYILEHVTHPERVVREMHRVARRGGRVAVCENDISLLRVDPPCPIFERVWLAFGRYQQSLGGDGLIGRRLYRLFVDAGFTRIELSMQPDVHWYGSPAFEPWIHNIVGNIESARRGLVQSTVCSAADIDGAITELEVLATHRDGSSQFVWNRAMASKD
jgi:ubiquinone/menaquinone biosynthesis C-methylase UbiE